MRQNTQLNVSRLVLLFAGLCFFGGSLSAKTNLPDFTLLVDDNAKAVVNISTTQKQVSASSNPHGLPDIPEDSPFYEFFKKYFGEMPEGEQPFRERSSLGSGFIVSKEGYVITNNHVIQDAAEIVVRLSDRRVFDATLVGKDERSDIALLKIDGENLPALKLGDSSKLKVGEWVLAIGSPFGLEYSVTKGIVSAMGRPLPNENYIPFIQTDVPINPGNSGGPLFNMDGEVVGVNSQIYSRTGGFMGLSFAVPINLVSNVYTQLRDQGHVSRGWLGVFIQDVNRELAESFGMKKPHGAVVTKVLPDGPAEEAGIEIGDIIVRYDGQEVSFSSELPPMVGSTPIGTKAPVEIIRRGKNRTIKIKISKLPEEGQIALSSGERQDSSAKTRLNIVVKDISPEQREEMDLDDHGILVERVMEGAARKAGLRDGDIVLIVNNIKVRSIAHFVELIDNLPDNKSIPILIQRRGGPIFLALKLTDPEAEK